MSAIQGIFGVVLILVLAALLYFGYRVLRYRLDQVFPPRAQATAVGPGQPVESWWDALQALRAHADNVLAQATKILTEAEAHEQKARAAEERNRKRIQRARLETDDEEVPDVSVEEYWEAVAAQVAVNGPRRVADVEGPEPPAMTLEERLAKGRALLAAQRAGRAG